eukprot:m.41530 g.41530  ORF g.41530 m.41530 type:complete len:99 (+) comp11834_c0_seq2:774-1070(+)
MGITTNVGGVDKNTDDTTRCFLIKAIHLMINLMFESTDAIDLKVDRTYEFVEGGVQYLEEASDLQAGRSRDRSRATSEKSTLPQQTWGQWFGSWFGLG